MIQLKNNGLVKKMEKWKKFLIGGYISIGAGLFSLCLTFLIIPLIFSVVPYHHSAIAVVLIVFGVVDVRYALTHKEESDIEYFIPYGRLLLTKKRIKRGVKAEMIEGLGTRLNPYKFKEPDKLPTNLKIHMKSINSFFQIENCRIEGINFEKCKNIIIDSCRVGFIHFDRCTDIQVINNKVNLVRLDLSNGIFFENNDMPEHVYNDLRMYIMPFPKGDALTVLIMSVLAFLTINIVFLIINMPLRGFLIFNIIMLVVPLILLLNTGLIKNIKFYNRMKNRPNIIN